MISNTALRDVESNSASTKEFSIKNSSKMFNMIISGLYSDKPQSITREIWSNAYDAHCMVGKQDVPFVVSLPNSLMQSFICRDFGPGIHHDDMEGFYTVLGHSTKESTNTAVGKWGVGRMSPMSYTDTFSVTSYHKGMVAHYSVQLGADGAPALHTLSEPTPTQEPDGLEVSFPVQRKDLRFFEEAAKRISLGFDVKPEVRGGKANWPEINCYLEGDGWKFIETSSLLSDRMYAKMGCVIYPIDTSAISGWGKTSLSMPWGKAYILEFDIGELEVTASRESLQYGRLDPTSDAIIKKVELVDQQFVDLTIKGIENAPTYGDALFAERSACIPRSVTDKVLWRGQRVAQKDALLPIKTPHKFTSLSNYGANFVRLPFSVDDEMLSYYPHDIYISVACGKERDVRANERIPAHRKGSGKYLTWFKVGSKADAQALMKELKERLGTSYNYVMVSDIPDTGPRVGNRSATTLKIWSQTSRYENWDDYSMPSEEFDKGGIYLPICNNSPLEGQSHWAGVARRLHKVGVLKSDKLIVVPKTHWKKFEEADNWKTLWDVGNKFIMKDLDDKTTFAAQILAYSVDYFRYLVGLNLHNPLFSKLNSYAIDQKEERWGLTRHDMNQLISYLGLGGFVDKRKNAPVELVETILKTYPLLKDFGRTPIDFKQKGALKEYVLSVDLFREQQEKLNSAA
jgi:hypothetical protein